MSNIVLCETKLGIVHFDWTFLFQIINTLLWFLIIYAVYKYIKNSKAKKRDLEERVTKLEDKLEKMNDESLR
jgi:amino acid permease